MRPEQQLDHQSTGAGTVLAEQHGAARVLAPGRHHLSGRPPTVGEGSCRDACSFDFLVTFASFPLFQNQISGYLLRKFKNSSGWQKLWVVLTSFCLYFYKSYSDDAALASLPLLGYSVGPPGIQDAVQKEFVFKLSFKNHTYFFRAESEHTYQR